ncbi:MAG TPA: hypothetical protein VN653_14060, partial [Anaerolineales bacterium]|nr:hypothetical protein [Anaerolineales bacterium]
MMKSLNALSRTTTVNHWLANSQQARILHVFDQACSLINERREVLSVVTPQIGNGPFNLVIQDDIIFTDHLDAESRIFVRNEGLQFGDLVINSTTAALWLARPNWEALHARREVILTQVAKLPITDHPPSNSLCLALASADLSRSITAAQKLAGLGAGL